ncbi:MAG TPA: hypothetical protein VE715_13510, partial [Blastocatellia bacterium]|nr:hypothetical protein [Blastocatellia bacterium]
MRSRIEDRGSRIEDRGSRIERTMRSSIFDLLSSNLGFRILALGSLLCLLAVAGLAQPPRKKNAPP